MTDQPSLFDLQEGERLKAEGMAAAAWSRDELLAEARNIAVDIALGRSDRTCWATLVSKVMEERGMPWEELGNAAGSIFKGGGWSFTGRYVKSARVSAHARRVMVWYLR